MVLVVVLELLVLSSCLASCSLAPGVCVGIAEGDAMSEERCLFEEGGGDR